jgi:protein involved in polysaccharide export with SLBB domain
MISHHGTRSILLGALVAAIGSADINRAVSQSSLSASVLSKPESTDKQDKDAVLPPDATTLALAPGVKPEAPAGQTNAARLTAFEQERKIASKVSNAERINIRVQGYATLSGEYRINGDGTLGMLGIGRLDIGDATISELEMRLAAEIARVSSRETNVVIEVVEYRPVFISGVVARAGSYPWKPGTSVLHAETLAGGLLRGVSTSEPLLMPTADRERERAVRSAYDLAATLASITRLRTEKSGSNTLVLPARLASLISKTEFESLNLAQLATLRSRNTAFTVRSSALENQKVLAEKEKGALEAQRTRIQEQLSQRRITLKKIDRMTDQGYARGERLFEEQIKISELEERLSTTLLAQTRVEMARAGAQQDLASLILGRDAERDTELLALEQKAALLEIEIESATGLYRRTTGQDALASRDAQHIGPSYEIVRVEAGKSRIVRADKSTALLPGDVVVIGFSRSN